jgi:hypothetical protein
MSDETKDLGRILARAMVEQGPVARGDYAAAHRAVTALREQGYEIVRTARVERLREERDAAKGRAGLYNRDMQRVREERDKLLARLDAADPLRQIWPEVVEALERACGIIETGDRRLMASDGPAGGQPPDISLREWRTMYVTLSRALTRAREIMEADDE